MTHITSLGTYPNMRAAFAEHTRLLTLFKTAHKRAEKVDLFIGASGDPRTAQVHELRVHWTKENEAEKAWFVAAAQGGAK